MKAELHAEVLTAIKREYSFKTQKGKWLQQGTCPACGKPELYANAEEPWVMRCGRLNRCGQEFHIKEEFPELFTTWSKRAEPRMATNPNAAADDYLELARGFKLDRIKGWYSQETYHDPKADNGRGATSATVRFPFAGTYWERLIDDPARFGKKKARFKPGGSYMGQWWCPPDLDLVAKARPDAEHAPGDAVLDLWLVEGVFDAISLHMNGIAAVALGSCNNYPEQALAKLLTPAGEPDAVSRFMANITAGGPQVQSRVRLVWAFDGDKAGIGFTFKFIERARKEGWTCTAAQIPQAAPRKKTDWNDLHLLDKLKPEHIEQYLHLGALLVAPSASEKALLIYRHSGGQRTEFDFDFRKRLYWFKLDLEAFDRAMRDLEDSKDRLDDEQRRDEALKKSHSVRPIASCKISALYYQRNAVTDESWYYFRIEFPHDAPEVRGTFTSAQLAAGAEFKKRLLHLAPGALFEGTSQMLDRMMGRQLFNIQRVETIDYIGYTREHNAWLLGDVAVKDGRVYRLNDEDYFHLGKLSLKSLNQSVSLTINPAPQDYNSDWVSLLWQCFGAKGLAALTFWLGSLFAEQLRATQKSYPFLEIVGEAGAGKSTLIEFLWKLLGRRDYEGFDPSKSSLAARARNFAQVANLPVVLIESDRERMSGEKAHVKSFDWDELKTAYNGRSVRARGMATGGNETYEPPFRGAIVISQNNEVAASEAILQRIVHLTFDRSAQTPKTREAAVKLEGTPVEEVSGFILRAAQAEGQILQLVADRTPIHEAILQARPAIKSTRIVKNHAQLLALAEALRKVILISDEQLEALQAQITTMAEERQRAISADHPLVQEFWESFDYLDSKGHVLIRGLKYDAPLLNHSRDDELIAVNLNEYVEQASAHRQQIPTLSDLKKVLRTSKVRRFADVKNVNSAIRTRTKEGEDVPATVYCWVFQRPSTKPAKA
ncbi:MAG: toprim domain-containing protein [Rubrivivax sp.]|nr:MAG: toprim domain-containing protein [Rubrivivax sp.]